MLLLTRRYIASWLEPAWLSFLHEIADSLSPRVLWREYDSYHHSSSLSFKELAQTPVSQLMYVSSLCIIYASSMSYYLVLITSRWTHMNWHKDLLPTSRTSHLTAFCAWDSSTRLLVTPVLLMRSKDFIKVILTLARRQVAALTLCEGMVTDANGVCFCSSNAHLVKTVISMH